MKKVIKLGRLELEILLFDKDFRKWGKPWHWQHKALASWTSFYGVVLNYRIFAFSLHWIFDHKGYELYNIEFIPNEKGMENHYLPYWDTWKVKDKEELQKRIKNYSDKFYIPLRAMRLLRKN